MVPANETVRRAPIGRLGQLRPESTPTHPTLEKQIAQGSTDRPLIGGHSDTDSKPPRDSHTPVHETTNVATQHLIPEVDA